jgi:hypothetical protein
MHNLFFFYVGLSNRKMQTISMAPNANQTSFSHISKFKKETLSGVEIK